MPFLTCIHDPCLPNFVNVVNFQSLFKVIAEQMGDLNIYIETNPDEERCI